MPTMNPATKRGILRSPPESARAWLDRSTGSIYCSFKRVLYSLFVTLIIANTFAIIQYAYDKEERTTHEVYNLDRFSYKIAQGPSNHGTTKRSYYKSHCCLISRCHLFNIMLLFWDLGARNHEVTLLKIKHIRLNEGYREGEIPREARTGCGPVLLTLWVCRDHVKIHNLCDCLAIMYHSTSFCFFYLSVQKWRCW